MRKLFFILIVFSVLVLAGCSAVNRSPSVSVDPTSYDFGEIVQNSGVVSTTFTVTNTGGSLLVINRLSTSCGCTTAEMNQDPLEPGESREMIVSYDPSTHPDILGELERVVYLQTNDPERPEVEIDLTGDTIK